MKKTLFFSAALLIGAIQSSIAQTQNANANAHAKATVVVPIAISNINDLNFGNIAVSASAGGTVVLDPTNNTRTSSNGVSLPANQGTVQAAMFEVTGAPLFTYTISVPSQLLVYNGSNNMTVNNFISTPIAGSLDNSGKQTLKIGATLTVNPNQADGNYQSSGQGFTVTVQYN
ncbi:DUF4402 domain-containing protein [Polluticoccus soli]|uniref:DUF4402 domain-containing protein n=1 Tax=Polluticoccus soli TaxID=3034150 RepID=UPI0023E0DF9E|nr:DUF4402 domain-containing protein [Flavipsychrobacter sp. JY13-12]